MDLSARARNLGAGLHGHWERRGLLVVAALLVVGLLVAVAPGLVGARRDLGRVETELSVSRELIERQVALTEQLVEQGELALELARRQVGLSERLVELAEQLDPMVRRLVELGEAGDARLAELLDRARRLQELTGALLHEAREINEKTPESARVVP